MFKQKFENITSNYKHIKQIYFTLKMGGGGHDGNKPKVLQYKSNNSFNTRPPPGRVGSWQPADVRPPPGRGGVKLLFWHL